MFLGSLPKQQLKLHAHHGTPENATFTDKGPNRGVSGQAAGQTSKQRYT